VFGLCAGIYAGAYSLASVAVLQNYATEHRAWLNTHTKNELVFQEFDVDINGKRKQLTLVGETHVYNQQESAFAASTISQYDLVLYEGAEKTQNKPFLTKAFVTSARTAFRVNQAFYGLATDRDRNNPTYRTLALKNHTPVQYLENNTHGGIDTLTLEQKTAILAQAVLGASVGPFTYWLEKEDAHTAITPLEDARNAHTPIRNRNTQHPSTTNSNNRDHLMALEIVRYLRERPETRVIAVTGRYHFFGIQEHLEQELTRNTDEGIKKK